MSRFALVRLFFLLALTASSAAAAEVEPAAAPFVLTAWTTADAPVDDIAAMAQDSAGFLWLATAGGLVRFDGFQFIPWGTRGEAPLPGRMVRALISARDGSLWAAFSDVTGVARIRGGALTVYDDALFDEGVNVLTEDQQGAIWAGGQAGLLRFRDNKWTAVNGELALPATEVYSLYVARRGALWVGTAGGVYRLDPGRAGFARVHESQVFVQSFGEDPSGTVWAGHTEQILTNLTSGSRPALASDVRLPTPGWRLLPTQTDLWIAALGGGLLRLRAARAGQPAAIERVYYEHTITGPPRSLFQDREHNVWVGLRGGGLLRVSESIVRSDTRLAGVTNDGVRALTAGPDGSVWVATGHNLNVFRRGGQHESYDITQTMALHTDAAGRVWAATHEGLGRVVNGRFLPLPLPRPVRFERATSLTSDPQGRLWLCTVDEGVLRLEGRELIDFEDVPELDRGPCTFAFTDRDGRVWLGFARGGVAVYDNGRFAGYTERHGLPSDTVMAIYQDSGGAIWISSRSGLTRIRAGSFVTADRANGLPGGIVPSLVEDAEGSFWLGVNSGAGLIRFDPEEMDRIADDPAHRLRYSLFDASDGLQGVLHWSSHPSAVRSGDNSLWFATGTGIAAVDPQRLPARSAPSQPRIERAAVDGTIYSAPSEIAIPPGASSLQIDYTALALSNASKFRFRYRLDGLNANWVDAGTSRVASYTNLPPGSYRFRLAATTDGAWTENETVLALSVAPPIYRRWPFYAGCLLLVVTGLGLYWRARMRAVRRRFAVVLDERTRLSREIHDTLLQDLGAIRLRLEVASAQVAASDRRSVESLRQLHTLVGRCIREARQSIWELRSPRRDTQDLLTGFAGLAADLRDTHGVTVDVVTVGTPRQCSQEMEEQLLRIGQEALNNAARHGRAARIDVTFDYSEDSLSMRVVDHGDGFVGAGEPPGDGHWGLLNMRERAESIGASFDIASEPGRGTTVEVVAPLSHRRLIAEVAL